MSKSEKEIKEDLEALADMLTDIKKRITAYNKLAASTEESNRLALLEGPEGENMTYCDMFAPDANFWIPSSANC